VEKWKPNFPLLLSTEKKGKENTRESTAISSWMVKKGEPAHEGGRQILSCLFWRKDFKKRKETLLIPLRGKSLACPFPTTQKIG